MIELRRTHQIGIVAGVPAVLLLHGLIGAVPALALVALIAVLGMPHGALDVQVLRHRFAGAEARAGLTYAGLALCVLACFALFPLASLVGFLLVSGLHFGLEDASGRPRAAAVAIRGALPIGVPSLAFPDQVGHLLGAVAGSPASAMDRLVVALAGAGCAALVGAAWLIALEIARAGRGSGRGGLLEAGEIAALVVLWLAVPPLEAFLLYYCGVHAVRHTLSGRLPAPAASWGALAGRFAMGMPASVAVIGLGVAGWWALPGNADGNAVRVLFQGLAALTVPHCLLAWGLFDALVTSRPKLVNNYSIS